MTAAKDWQQVAEEAILDHFRNHPEEPFHADYLWHVIPDEYRGVISLAVMAVRNKKWMVGCGYRKSAIPSRKGSPSQEYRLTELGRDRLAGNRAGASGRTVASAVSGETPAGVDTNNREGQASSNGASLDRPASSHSMSASPAGARSSLGVDPGGTPQGDPGVLTGSAGEPRPSCEPVPLFEEEQRPKSAITDPEVVDQREAA